MFGFTLNLIAVRSGVHTPSTPAAGILTGRTGDRLTSADNTNLTAKDA